MTKRPAPYMSLHCNACGKDVFKQPEDYFMLKKQHLGRGNQPRLRFANRCLVQTMYGILAWS